MATSGAKPRLSKSKYPPRARDGHPFQLANPDLVYALTEDSIKLLRAQFPEHPKEVVKHVEKHLRKRGFGAAAWAVQTYPLEFILEAINAYERDFKNGFLHEDSGAYLHKLIKLGCEKESRRHQKAGA